MRSYISKISLLLLCWLLGSGGCTQVDHTWDVLALGLPNMVTPAVASLNMGLYILKQTHEPFFRSDRDDNIFSNILTHWERTPDDTHFTFCPNQTLSFDKKQSFTPQFVAEYLQKIAATHDLQVSIRIASDCVALVGDKPLPQLLHMLSDYEFAPSVASDNPKIEFGLGPYFVKQLTEKEVVLERKQPRSDGYNVIRFINYTGKGMSELSDRTIEDFNRVYVEDLPDWLQHEYEKYDVSLLQSINLLINIPSAPIREAIYHCMDIQQLRAAFMPHQQHFADIATVLPIGMAGAVVGRAPQHCALANKLQQHVSFLNWKPDNIEPLTRVFADFEKRTGITITMHASSPTALLAAVNEKPHPYELTIVAIDAVKADYSAFFGYLIDGKRSLHDIGLPSATAICQQAIDGVDGTTNRTVDQCNAELANAAILLPLYQEVRSFFYPKSLKHIEIGKNFLEYPEIGDIRL